ncbi:MAG: hypothetical protein KF769_08240 [Parvibaculum sp.]|nr:hypothetical protein [Parvibaculum sp.]
MAHAIPVDCFLHSLERVPWKGEVRWRSKDGRRIYTWDRLHGEIEVFNQRGRHLGVLGPSGLEIKPAVKGRSIDV